MVHQHFMLVPVFTVAENLMLGNEVTSAVGRLDLDAARTRIAELSERYGMTVDPDALVEDLPVGVQQRAEILKALYRDAGLPDPRRADRGAHPHRDRRPREGGARRSPMRASRSSSSPTSSER